MSSRSGSSISAGSRLAAGSQGYRLMLNPVGFQAVRDWLRADVRQAFVAAYANSIDTVLLIAVPVAALASVAAWLIRQLELRRATGAPAGPAGPE